MKKISKKFNLLLILSITISVILASIFATGLLIYKTEEENHKQNLMQLRSLSDNMEGFFTAAYTLNYQLSLNPLIIDNVLKADSDWDRRLENYGGFPFLEEMAEEYNWVQLFFVQDKEGFQTARSSGELGDRSNRWFIKQLNGDERPFISQSYYSMTGDIPVASVFHPIKKGGKMVGIIGTDINFHSLQEIVGGYLYSDTTSAILIDSTGTVVAHPDPKPIIGLYNLKNNTREILLTGPEGTTLLDEKGYHLTQTISAEVSPYLQDAAKRLLEGEEGFMKGVIVDDRLSSLYFKNVPFPGAEQGDYYGVILIYDHSDFVRFVSFLMVGLIFMIVLGSLLLYLFFQNLFQIRILTPLNKLIDAMKDNEIIAYQTVELNTGDEFDLLASTYNNLRRDLAQTHIDLQVKMNELALSEEGYRAFASISLAMAGEKDPHKIFWQIVREGMDLCRAEGGTLYLYDREANHLVFEILVNDVLNIKQLKNELGENFFPPVPLMREGRENMSNVSSFCALTGELVNIEDVYDVRELDFEGMKRYDKQNNYRSRSMLVVPMTNLEGEIVGVLQLINSHDPRTDEICPFSDHHENIARVLATLGAVTLTNLELYNNQELFLYSFVRSIAAAIDERSSFTGGHIQRVAALTSLLAQKVNETKSGRYGNVQFSEEELEEIRLAAWMHDVGKISIPDRILDKSKKLMMPRDGFTLIETRASLIMALWEIEAYHNSPDKKISPEAREKLEKKKADLKEKLALIQKSNNALSDLTKKNIDELKDLARISAPLGDRTISLLTEEELHFLSIPKGTLDRDEKKLMESHVSVSRKILAKLPFPKHLARVPLFAAQHHERLDGSGYDQGVKGDKLPLQSRIIAISDILEALTAHDRPYRMPLTQSEAMKILSSMCEQGLIDRDLFQLMSETELAIFIASSS
ncbi:MAG: cache domain-containing protein [Spirochaetales bacterium]|nr:cache domain-containing protein [Spirochaetales bacterium]